MIKEIVKVTKEGEHVSYEKLSIDKYDFSFGEVALSHSFVMDVLRKVMGKTLTIIDASIIDKQQNKALKDLLRQIISDEMEFTSEISFDQEKLLASIPVDEDLDTPRPATIEEVLGVGK